MSRSHDGTGRLSDSQSTSAPYLSSKRPAAGRMSSAPEKSSNVSTFVPLQKSTSRTRLNLLNPMNLLARRRSHQAAEKSPTAKATSGVQRATVGYEGIRGTKVHDFSAPRPKPRVETLPQLTVSSTHDANGAGQDIEPQDSRSATTASTHTPVFKEDFEDGQSQFPAAGPHVRKASDFSDLTRPMPAYAMNKELPAKPRSPEPETGTLERQDVVPPMSKGQVTRPEYASRTLSYDAGESEEVDSIPIEGLEIASRKTTAAGSQSGRPRNVSNASLRISSMKHMKSNSSRFSFDMIGAATQEKLLEDRHREKAAENQLQVPAPDPYDDEDEDGFDYDDMMDDGLEERIPGVNADLDAEDEEVFDDDSADHQNLNGFTFHPLNTSTLASPISPEGPPAPTPRDSRGDIIGAALTMTPVLPTPNPLLQPETPEEADEEYSERVRISLEQDLEDIEATEVMQDSPIKPQWQLDEEPGYGIPGEDRYESMDDDMYFDDGTFGFDDDEEPIPMAGCGDFDESIFDNNDTDEYGRPIRNFDSSIPTTNYSPPGLTSDEASRRESAQDQLAKAEKEMAVFAEGMSAFGLAGNLQPQPSVSHPSQPTISLTQDSLNAHLQALAAHTQAAQLSGRFRRESDEGGNGVNPYQFNSDNALADDFEDAVEDDFDYNDEFDEDDLIASANAEALAHDSGWYAQEFGFYSQPAPAAGDEAVYANGGYFGPSGAGAITINRTKSGKVLEPNLTPITERSEYSNRNSIMSLPQLASQHGGSMVGSPNSLGPNMGLAQIAGMLREDDAEENMSISALMRLRNKKWGGSQNSLSLGGQTPNDNRLSTGSPAMGHGAGNGFAVGPGREDGASSPQWTHTPWQQQMMLSSSPEMTRLQLQQEAYGLTRHAQPMGHRREGSAGALSLGSENGEEGHTVMPAEGSPILTFSPPPEERMGMHGQQHSGAVYPDGYFAQQMRPGMQLQHSSKTITQQSHQQSKTSPPLPANPTTDIPPPPTQLRHSLEGRPTSPKHPSYARGLVSPTISTFDNEVGFFSKKGKEVNPEFRRHKQTGSSDSISYMKEEDPVHPERERWVLERRRTGEGGEGVVEREVVKGGRI